jgi:alkylated DNA repair dioxygenase AlkB
VKSKIPLADADIQFDAAFFDATIALDLMRELQETTPWETHVVRIFGREMPAPRQSSWHGDAHCSYRYSNVVYRPKAWTPALSHVRARLLSAGFGDFNCVLANWYRSGSDSMGWHSDDEPELGDQPTIASLSFGAPRRFCLRRKSKSVGDVSDVSKHQLLLTPGSLLLMAGNTQKYWQHALPKTARVGAPRINLTFRQIAKQNRD